ncbi:MAG: glycerol-3-phosphate 1-O-acyltransferase PlsY [Gammaproteobacteria bacterium]|nr:glycerol-3-phosphate 1-O-acyltransferase PlsY [Gammaproteobacteria bacterium]
MQTTYWIIVLSSLFAYCIGSFSSAVITCKIMGLPDPRSQGSGNPGATNVLRFGGKKAAIITLVCDVLKGVIPVLIAKSLGFDELTLACVAFAAFIGHLYPVFFKFKGGKGVATAFGCLAALSWPLGLSIALTWLLIAVVFRYSSLSALIAALVAPIFAAHFTNLDYTIMTSIMAVLLIYRHKRNIQNLIAGKEDKIGKKKKSP